MFVDEFQKSDWFLNISNDGLNFWAASLIRNPASICVEFQYLVDESCRFRSYLSIDAGFVPIG